MTRTVSIPLEDLCFEHDPEPAGGPFEARGVHEPHIRRHPTDPTWVVGARDGNQMITVEFADRLYGGTLHAVEAAKGWRDAQFWYGPSWGHAPSVNAVRRYECPLAGGGSADAVWYASGVHADGRKWISKFSVATWGDEGAMHKAMHERDLHAWEIEAPLRRAAAANQARARREPRSAAAAAAKGKVITGVLRGVTRPSARHPEGLPYWQATWVELGVMRRHRFRIAQWGELGAKQKAAEALRDAVARMSAAGHVPMGKAPKAGARPAP